MSIPFGIMYHHLHGGVHPKVEGSISADELAKTLTFLQKSYNILSADEWTDGYLSNSLSSKDICITFDDGLKCQFDVAKPVLDEFGIKAYFFVYTSPLLGNIEKLELYRYFKNTEFKSSDDFYEAFYNACQDFDFEAEVAAARTSPEAAAFLNEFSFYTKNDKIFRYVRDKILGRAKYFAAMDEMIKLAKFPLQGLVELLWMTPQDVKTLADEGHVIGLHSHTHPTAMGDLTKQQQTEEYFKNKQVLEKIIGKKVGVASHPSNSYNSDTLGIFEELGIKLAFRANMKLVAGKYTIPREDHIIIHKQAQAA